MSRCRISPGHATCGLLLLWQVRFSPRRTNDTSTHSRKISPVISHVFVESSSSFQRYAAGRLSRRRIIFRKNYGDPPTRVCGRADTRHHLGPAHGCAVTPRRGAGASSMYSPVLNHSAKCFKTAFRRKLSLEGSVAEGSALSPPCGSIPPVMAFAPQSAWIISDFTYSRGLEPHFAAACIVHSGIVPVSPAGSALGPQRHTFGGKLMRGPAAGVTTENV